MRKINFTVDVECSTPESKIEVTNFELNANLKLPTDYKYLLLNFNELRLANDAMAIIQDETGREISGMDGAIFSLHSFSYAHDPFPSFENLSSKIAKEASENFFSIGTLFFQGILLIGKTPTNENEIYGFVPEYRDVPFYLAKSIFDFFNDRITVVT